MSAFVNAKTVLCAALLAVSVTAAPVLSEEAADSPEHAQKVALIKELLEVSRSGRNAELGFQTVLDQQMQGYHVALSQRIDSNANLSDEQKAAAKRVAMSGYTKRVARLKELFAEKVNVGQLVTDSYVKLYDKHFTTPEVQDLLAFYKSPTGQKTLNVLPAMTKEMMTEVNEIIIPKMKDIDAQMMADEKSGKFNQ